MKLTTKGRYGLKAMFYLGELNELEMLNLKDLAIKTDISESYLEKLLGILRRKNLVKSIRGAQGGYMLAKNAENITIGDILRALENNLYLADCNSGCCKKTCPNYSIFNLIYEKINLVLDQISLKQMIEGDLDE